MNRINVKLKLERLLSLGTKTYITHNNKTFPFSFLSLPYSISVKKCNTIKIIVNY